MAQFTRRAFVGGATGLTAAYVLGVGRAPHALAADAVPTPLEAFISAIPESGELLLDQGWLYYPAEALTRASSSSTTLVNLLESSSPGLGELGSAGASTFDFTWPYRQRFLELALEDQQRVIVFALSGESTAPQEFAAEFGGRQTPPADQAASQDPTIAGAPDDDSGWSAGIGTVVAAVQLYLVAANAPPEPPERTGGSTDGESLTEQDLATLGYEQDPEN